ncbi:MAG: ATP-binding protein [Puniceicoccaceae bacterium]
MLSKTISRAAVWGLILACVLPAVSFAKPFQPGESPELLELWRWNRLEKLQGFRIWCGIESQQGDLWFGATEGLVRYDGYQTELIPYPESFGEVQPVQLIEDEKSGFYISSSNGVIFYDGEWAQLVEYNINFSSSKFLFAESRTGLLVAAADTGLYRLSGGKATLLARFDAQITSLAVSGQNDLFIAVLDGSKVFRIPFTLAALGEPEIWDWDYATNPEATGLDLVPVLEDGTILATDYYRNSKARLYSYESNSWEPVDVPGMREGFSFSSGLSVDDGTFFLTTKTSMYVYSHGRWETISGIENEIPLNAPYFFLRRNGNLVIGGRSESVWEVDVSQDRFSLFPGLHYQCEDLNGNSWFISADGLVVVNESLGSAWKTHDENVISTPTKIICASDGTVWVSGSHEGVAAVCYFDGIDWSLYKHPDLVSNISHLSAREMSNGEIWFGSGHEFRVDLGGIIAFFREGNGYAFRHLTLPEVAHRIVGIAESSNKDVWFGGFNLTYNKLSLENPVTTVDELDVDWIDHLAITEDDTLYIASWQAGVFQYKDGDWKKFGSPDYIISDKAVYVLPDRLRENNLWVATNQGISRFDNGDWIPLALPEDFRMQREGGTMAQSPDGGIWLNFATRDWYFRGYVPEEESVSGMENFRTVRYFPEMDPPIVEMAYFDKGATEPANVLVRWEGIDRWSKTPTDQLRYSYRVDGGEWSSFEVRTELLLTSMQGGDHIVEVRAKDLDGNLSEASAIAEFRVLHPIWQRPWFIISGLAMVSVIIILIILLVRQRIRHLLQMENFKLQFFTNISHELRTPLTVIMGPLESALARLPDSFDKTPIELAYRNSRKMLHLIDQILEFRRAEVGKLENHYVVSNVIKNVDESIQLMQPLSKAKDISMSTSYSHDAFIARYDAEKVERILNNLVGNAIKYSHEHGSITVKVRILSLEGNRHTLFLVVEDDGDGIRSDKLRHIFDPFYRVQGDSDRRKIRGVGLGLSLVKSLVSALEGEIKVESPAFVIDGKSKGTRFIVEVPIEATDDAKLEIEDEQDELAKQADSDHEIHDHDVLLVVDDEKEIREFISYEFKTEFEVITAEDGKDGLDKAIHYVPDLILTDILMPEMDGNALIEEIRKHKPTCHIPVIALTALKNEEHELKSLAKGADDFLNKPISVSILRQKIRNAIRSRHQLRDMYQSRKSSQGEASEIIPTGSADDAFLNHCKALVESRMADPLFDINSISAELGMSRMTLYRKFKAITGDPPSQFVREIKMRAAVRMLVEEHLTVSEVADSVGFHELSNFSVAFKKFYGKTPSQYQAEME